MIDVATRFPRTTLKDAYERSKRQERWVFPEVVCSSVTLLYGRSNVGKSYLVASMLLSLLIEGREFLGMQPVDKGKLWKPAILWTDPGSEEEYGERICEHLPVGVEVEVPMFHLGRTTTAAEWDALADFLLTEGFNFVVVDNLMGVTGDTNDSSVVTTVFDGLTKLTNRGVPVVVLHHESEHGGSNPGGPPMGASVIVQKSRLWVQVRQTAKRKLRGGNTALVIQGNALAQPQQLVAEPMAGPDYKVLNRGPWQSRDELQDEKQPKQKRSAEVLTENARMAAWVVETCQGVGVNQVAVKLSQEFGKAESTCKDKLTRGAVASLVNRSGEGSATVWTAST